ncbi:MAG TPA: lysophospholipid acyltransferase family protein [Ktedonobacteraceae bacterium]|nr:lysophospholipid acyltransferase family protein [Ktedonobacteraceae bacterium]
MADAMVYVPPFLAGRRGKAGIGASMYYLFLWATKIVPRLPRRLLRWLPAILGPLTWLVAVSVRRRATINALHVLGPEIRQTAAGRRKLRRVVRGMFRSSINNYLEAFLMPRLSSQEVMRRLSTEHNEYLEEALALGKGVILFSAHFGPFEYMARWFTANSYRVVIPVEKLKDERILRLMIELRSSSGVNYVPLGGSAPLRTIIQALRNNQIVLITADRAVEGESVVRDFFGAPACLPIGPVNLSMRTGAPLVGALGWYSSGGRIRGEFIRLTLALSEEERRQPEIIEGALLKELERVIRAHPEQWVVFSKVWVE